MKKVLLLVVLVFSIFVVSANNVENKGTENVVISGKVVDSESGEALAGVCVKIENSNYEVYTDLDGKFEIKVEEGKTSPENIIVSYISYQEKKIKFKSASNFTIAIEQVL